MTDADRVGVGGEHDGDRFGQWLDNPDFGRRCREYDVNIGTDQLGGKLRQLLDRFREAELDGDVFALDIPQFAQAGLQCFHAGSGGRRGAKP